MYCNLWRRFSRSLLSLLDASLLKSCIRQNHTGLRKHSFWWVGSQRSRLGSNSLDSSVTNMACGDVEADSIMQIFHLKQLKHPVFLNSHHHFFTLIVWDAHAQVQHDGIFETLTELRDRYWIVRGQSFVRGVLHKGVTCCRFEGRPHYPPPSPLLPAFRVKEAPAFAHTGVDYVSPLFIKSDNVSKESKVWICLYTCCIVRAIHLEVVSKLTAQSFKASSHLNQFECTFATMRLERAFNSLQAISHYHSYQCLGMLK